jgi:acyl dehydratase
MLRMMVDGFFEGAASYGFPGVDEIRWIKPVRGGDTLTVTSTSAEARPSKSKSDRGIVHTLWEAINQHGDIVAAVKGMGMYRQRPA